MISRDKKTIQLGVAAIISNDIGNVLVAKTPKLDNGWTIPGGHLEFGEKTEEALCREVLEETGLKIKVEKLINICETIIEEKSFHIISFHFWCKLDGSSDLKPDSRELTDLKWVSPKEAVGMMGLDDFRKSIEMFNNLSNIYVK